jgi:hypothetical protein
MKKIISIAAIAVLLSVISLNAQIRWGLAGGLNMANAEITYSGQSVSTSSITSFYVGVIGVNPISDKMNIQAGALFSGKGVKSTEADMEANPIGIEIPVNLQFVLESGSMKFLPYGGLYLGIGMMGKIKMGGVEQDIKYGDSETDNMKRLDFGLGFGLAVDLGNKIIINGQYQLGLQNVTPITNMDVKLRTFSIGIQYMFSE